MVENLMVENLMVEKFLLEKLIVEKIKDEDEDVWNLLDWKIRWVYG